MVRSGSSGLLRHRFRSVIILTTLFIQGVFVIIKDPVIDWFGLDISTHMGEPSPGGYYDYGDYTLQVNNLLATGSLFQEGKLLNRYPPVYPGLLYSLHRMSEFLGWKPEILITILAILFHSLSALLVAEILFFFTGNQPISYAASIIFVTHPYILQGLVKTMSVTPFMTFLYAGSLLFLIAFRRDRPTYFIYFFLVGVLLGGGMLIRPIGIFLPLLFIAFYLLYGWKRLTINRLIKSVLLFAGAILIIAPWQSLTICRVKR